MSSTPSWTFGVSTAMAVFLCSAPQARAQAPPDRWSFAITPYLWLPTVDGTLSYDPPPEGGATPDVDLDAETILGALDGALMLAAEARKGDWSISTNFIFVDLEADRSAVKSIDFNPSTGPIERTSVAVDAGTTASIDATYWALSGGYSLVATERAELEVIAGVRYLELQGTVDWRLATSVTAPGGTVTFPATGTIEGSSELWDAVVGVGGRFRFSASRWFAPYQLDAGGGSSTFTWQTTVGIARAFDWGDLLFAYRFLSYETGDLEVLEDLRFAGVGAGVTFRF